jgi:capsular exopolysaccharide synthesis family protein
MSETPDESTASLSPDISAKELLAIRLYRIKLLAFRYWWVVLLTVSIGLAIQGYRWSIQIPRYVSSARMMMNGQVNLKETTVYNEEYSNFFGTEVALMKSQDTFNVAAARVRVMHPEVEVDPTATIGAAQEPRTSIFDLQVSATNPQYAQLLLNAIMDTYLSKKKNRREHTTDEALTAFTAEKSNLENEINTDEQKIMDFQKDNNEAYIEEQSSNTASYLVGLNNELARLSKERDLLALEKTNPGETDNTSTPDSNNNIAAEEAFIEKLKISRDYYSNVLKDKHPKMIALTDSINQEEKFLASLKTKDAESKEAYFVGLEEQIQNLEKQITDWNQKSLDLNQRLATVQQLKAKIARETNMYEQLASSIQNLDLNNSIDMTNVSVYEEASPAYLVPVSLPLQLAYSLFMSLPASIAIIYFISRLEDEKVDSTFELAEAVQVPVIGQVPLTNKLKKDKRLRLISDRDTRHGLVESLRDLRSFILFYSTENRPKSMLICSAEPNEGKSTMVANLAITFAVTGLKVLLIDADLRRGILHTLFEVPSTPGLSEYLEGQVAWQEVMQKTKIPTLDLLPRGIIPDYPGELLLSHQADVLFQESVAHYDVVLWDSAPLLAADDAANMCPKVDALLFVVRSRTSSVRAVRTALEILSRRSSKLLGIILNAVQPNQPGYYARYRYKNYYTTFPKNKE